MLRTLIGVSISTGIVIGIIILFLPLLNKKFTVKLRYWIWLLLAFRLIIPLNFIFEKPLITLNIPTTIKTTIKTDDLYINSNENSILEKGLMNEKPKVMNEKNEIKNYKINVLFIIWIIGAIGIFSYRFIGYYMFKKSVQRWILYPRNEKAEIILQELKDELNIKTNVTLIISERAPGPLVFGFCHSMILLPNNQYPAKDLKMILKHELIHVKRHDIWYKLILAIAVSIHWFNPFIYVMINNAYRDLELSCDEEVLEGKNLEYRKLYSNAILRAMVIQKVNNNIFSTYLGGKQIMKQRFKNILEQRRKSKGIITFCIVFIIIGSMSGLVACSYNKTNTDLQSEKVSTNSATDEISTVSNEISTASDEIVSPTDVLTTEEAEPSTTQESDPVPNQSISDNETTSKYETEADFLNSPEGVSFQVVAFKCAKAFLSGNLKEVSEYFIDQDNALIVTNNVFDDIDYIILKWTLGDIKTENEINASYQFNVKGEDTVSYLTMSLQKVDDEWKVKEIVEEK